MLYNSFDLEKYILATRPEELRRELKHIDLLEEAISLHERKPVLQKILESIGWMLVKFGSRLVSKYDLSDCSPIRHPDIKIA